MRADRSHAIAKETLMEASTPAPPPPPEMPPPATAAGDYPVRVDADMQPEYNRFLPLVKWLLAIPHYLVLIVLGIAVVFVHLIAFFAVLFTARYPRGLFDFVVGVYRWGWRVGSYVFLLHDQYPPFTLADDPSFPAEFEIDYPERIDRWRPLVQWLLIIPYYIVAYVLVLVAEIVAFIGVFVILFTKQLPEGMFKLILNPFRWMLRAQAYGYFVVTRYPPFEWE
jgi:Domain of unknown function (DUF4389)